MNIIFFGGAGNVTFKCIFSGQDYLCFFDRRVISYFLNLHIYTEYIIFPCIYWERSSFLLHLKNKIIFSRKRNIIFPGNTRNIIFQCDFFGKTIFSEHLEKENIVYRAVLNTKKGGKLCSANFLVYSEVKSEPSHTSMVELFLANIAPSF